MPVFPAEPIAGGHIRFAVVVFPNFVKERVARFAPQRFLFENVSLLVRVQLQETFLCVPVEAVRQDDEDFAIGCFGFHRSFLSPAKESSVHSMGDLPSG